MLSANSTSAHMSNLITAVQDWEATFNGLDLAALLTQYADVPFYVVGVYLTLVFAGQAWMKNRPAFNLKPLFIVWNFLLAAFSIIGAYKMTPVLLENLATHGYHFTVCRNSFAWWNTGACGAWMALFGLSKIPELIDTVFLVFQKKPVIFLHWYHHTTVMLYCWFAYVTFTTAGIWFGAMNFAVHSVMYTYYFFMSASGFTRNLVRPFAQLITLLQIAQMIVGLVCAVMTQIYRSSHPEGCEGANPAATRAAVVMYVSYFVLFGHFFVHNYVLKKNKKRNAEVCGAASAVVADAKKTR